MTRADMALAPTSWIDLDRIDVPPNRLRDADPGKVDELAVSFAEIGQLQPIHVLPNGERFTLNIGLHRFMAARKAGWSQIEAKLFDGTVAQARLAEIDENLYRAELTPYDQAAFLAERRTIYEALNGPVRGGRPKKNHPKSRRNSFFDEVTAKFGLARSTVQLALFRWNRITPEARDAIRGTGLAKNGNQLDALARLAPTFQLRVVNLLLEGGAHNVAEAMAKVRGDRLPSADEQQLNRLEVAWAKAGSMARRMFLDNRRARDELTEPKGRRK